jgi:hypothetical protein
MGKQIGLLLHFYEKDQMQTRPCAGRFPFLILFVKKDTRIRTSGESSPLLHQWCPVPNTNETGRWIIMGNGEALVVIALPLSDAQKTEVVRRLLDGKVDDQTP